MTSNLRPAAPEQSNYGDEDIPFGPKLSAYPLQTAEWREAFLTRLTEVGYVGLTEASTHVYDQLLAPRDFHCALIGQLAGKSGTGKLAIFNVLEAFLDDYLSVPSLPDHLPQEDLEHWHARVMDGWKHERDREQQLIAALSRVLNGEKPGPVLAAKKPPVTGQNDSVKQPSTADIFELDLPGVGLVADNSAEMRPSVSEPAQD